MKKIIAVLLVLLMTAGCACAQAEEQIRFKGLKWGSNVHEFEALFPGAKWNTVEKDGYFRDISDKNSAVEVAGHPGAAVLASFLYRDSADADHETAVLYRVAYLIHIAENEDGAAAFRDLADKLESIYGKCGHKSSAVDVYTWDGADGTKLTLTDGGGDISISYSCEPEFALESAQILSYGDSVDGL